MACLLVLYTGTGCAFKSISRYKNITYLPSESPVGKAAQRLDVFAPKKNKAPKPVLVFIYGGSWNSGNKGLYRFFGTRLARKGVVSVIADYPKSPGAGYEEMAIDVALAVKWVKDSINKYGGDPLQIFLSGHSAGGHLAALVGVKNKYFRSVGINNPLQGLILIDAAGLDMYSYLRQEGFEKDNSYIKTFSNDPKNWKEASPIYFLHDSMPRMLIFRGGKTYPSIEEGNEKFVKALRPFMPAADYRVLPRKKHVPMILQFFNSSNPRYADIIRFMQTRLLPGVIF